MQATVIRSAGIGYWSAAAVDAGPLALWMGDETTGTNAADSSGNGYNGTYGGSIQLAQFGTPVGSLCPRFDDANDYINTYSAGYASAFNLDEGSLLIWGRVYNLATWTNGKFNRLAVMVYDASNRLLISKSSANNTLAITRSGNGTTHTITIGSLTTTEMFSLIVSWSVSGDHLKAYMNAVQLGGTQTGLVAAAGSLSSSGACIGALNTGGTDSWDGYLCPCAVWDHSVNDSILELGKVA